MIGKIISRWFTYIAGYSDESHIVCKFHRRKKMSPSWYLLDISLPVILSVLSSYLWQIFVLFEDLLHSTLILYSPVYSREIYFDTLRNYANDCTPYECKDAIEEVIECLEWDFLFLFEWYENNYLKFIIGKYHLKCKRQPVCCESSFGEHY